MEKEVYKVSDIQVMLGNVSYSVACRKMREVKAVSDRLNIRGIIHKKDWEDYLTLKSITQKANI